ncbi:MAG: type II CAAX endopeptidase family protein [Hespellia sp.]|nr:type II CAAX endopeptidase family protein [Hespellia sp.]
MEQKQRRGGFGRVIVPLLLFWVIQWIGSAIISSVISMSLAWPELQKILDKYANAETLSSAQTDAIWSQISKIMTDIIPAATKIILEHSAELTALLGVLTLPVMFFFFARDRKLDREEQRPVNKKAPLYKYVFLAGLGVTACIALNNLENMCMMAFDLNNSYSGTAEGFYSASFPIQIICLGLITPLAEEIFYRGVLFQRYRENGTFMIAAIYSSLLFSISHSNLVQVIFALVVGMLMAYAYEKYGSVKAPIFLHMMVNITSLVLTRADGFTWMFKNFARLGLVTVGCVFAGSVLFVMIQGIDEKPENAVSDSELVE